MDRDLGRKKGRICKKTSAIAKEGMRKETGEASSVPWGKKKSHKTPSCFRLHLVFIRVTRRTVKRAISDLDGGLGGNRVGILSRNQFREDGESGGGGGYYAGKGSVGGTPKKMGGGERGLAAKIR